MYTVPASSEQANILLFSLHGGRQASRTGWSLRRSIKPVVSVVGLYRRFSSASNREVSTVPSSLSSISSPRLTTLTELSCCISICPCSGDWECNVKKEKQETNSWKQDIRQDNIFCRGHHVIHCDRSVHGCEFVCHHKFCKNILKSGETSCW